MLSDLFCLNSLCILPVTDPAVLFDGRVRIGMVNPHTSADRRPRVQSLCHVPQLGLTSNPRAIASAAHLVCIFARYDDGRLVVVAEALPDRGRHVNRRFHSIAVCFSPLWTGICKRSGLTNP